MLLNSANSCGANGNYKTNSERLYRSRLGTESVHSFHNRQWDTWWQWHVPLVRNSHFSGRAGIKHEAIKKNENLGSLFPLLFLFLPLLFLFPSSFFSFFFKAETASNYVMSTNKCYCKCRQIGTILHGLNQQELRFPSRSINPRGPTSLSRWTGLL